MDRVLRARVKMMKNKAKGLADCLVTEMLQCLPMERVHGVSQWFDKRYTGECRAPVAWRSLRLVFLKRPDGKLEKDNVASGQGTSKRIFKMVHDVSGGLAARRKGADKVDEFARGSRERSQL